VEYGARLDLSILPACALESSDADERQRVAELVATPEQRAPIKVLMVTATHGFRHTYGIEGAVALMRELEKTIDRRDRERQAGRAEKAR